VSAEPPLPREGSTLAVLHQARERHTTGQWRMLPFGLIALAVVALAAAQSRPGLGLHGNSLGLTLALAGFAGGIMGLRAIVLVHRTPVAVYGSVLAMLLLSCGVMEWLQPTGPALGGCSIAIASAMAARAIPVRIGAAFLLAAIGFAALVLAHVIGPFAHQRSWSGVGVNAVPFAGMVLLVLVAWRIRVGQEQSARLLALMETTRSAELRSATLAERQRVAREMHDVLAHSLSGLVLQLEAARLLAASTPETASPYRADDRLAGVIDRALALGKAGLAEARQAIETLRDDELPGPERLRALAEGFAADTGIPCQVDITGQASEISSAVKLTLYRVAQEALTNIRKHARAERAHIQLNYDPQSVSLSIEDTGADVPTPQDDATAAPVSKAGPGPGGGYGLTGMRERAELLGGTLTAGRTGNGFRVTLKVPR
jgi:signal transduction histidine kinase